MTAPRIIAILTGAAGLAGAFFARRRREHQRRPIAHLEQWRCDCGQRYRVAGADRHRVYWLEGSAENDPVLGGLCPSCDRALPSEHHTVTAGLAA